MREAGTGPGSAPGEGVCEWLRRAVVAMVAVFAWVFVPGIEQPFSRPKLMLLTGFVASAGAVVLSTGQFRWASQSRGFRLSLVAWPLALVASALCGEFVSRDSLLLHLCSMGWFLLLLAVRPRPAQMAAAIAMSCAAMAALVLLQYFDLDPFHLFGWTPPRYGSPRMRIVGTLGNPNFVAAVLVAGMPLTAYLARQPGPRALYPAVVALLATAVLATGSRAAIAAIVASHAWIGLLGQFRRWRMVAAVSLAVVVLALLLPQRSLLDTLRGRFYVWTVVASHVFERPLLGSGPGAFEPQFIRWETDYWRAGRGSAEQRQFAGLQAHAHNDYLEILADSGLTGILGFVSLAAAFLVLAFRQAKDVPGGFSAAASAGVVSLLTVAIVDFPLHRPAALFLFWTLMGLVYLESETLC